MIVRQIKVAFYHNVKTGDKMLLRNMVTSIIMTLILTNIVHQLISRKILMIQQRALTVNDFGD